MHTLKKKVNCAANNSHPNLSMNINPAIRQQAMFLLLISLSCFVACKKDKKNEPEEVEVKGPVVSTFAGSVNHGFKDGTGETAKFLSPTAISIDLFGNVYVADYANHAVRKITPEGVVSTLAGGRSGNTELASSAFTGPSGIAVDWYGNVFVGDSENNNIKQISPAGKIKLIAGSTKGDVDGPLGSNRLSSPSALAIDDASGSIYITQFTSYVKRLKDGEIKTLAGGLRIDDGQSPFRFPLGIAINAQKELIIADYGKHQILKINANDEVSVVAGSGMAGNADGVASEASFNLPQGLAIDKAGNIYVADRGNHKIRMISTAGLVSTIAGTDQYGAVDGPAHSASFFEPSGIAIDVDGNLLITDRGNHQIRKITFPR